MPRCLASMEYAKEDPRSCDKVSKSLPALFVHFDHTSLSTLFSTSSNAAVSSCATARSALCRNSAFSPSAPFTRCILEGLAQLLAHCDVQPSLMAVSLLSTGSSGLPCCLCSTAASGLGSEETACSSSFAVVTVRGELSDCSRDRVGLCSSLAVVPISTSSLEALRMRLWMSLTLGAGFEFRLSEGDDTDACWRPSRSVKYCLTRVARMSVQHLNRDRPA
mmetsp:Transcript_113624/g.196989  ORF Transcript_113624/g.196989 Transcript_113624/m.196989 type:complete len:220 (+) Transcript_113624:206-865(+)